MTVGTGLLFLVKFTLSWKFFCYQDTNISSDRNGVKSFGALNRVNECCPPTVMPVLFGAPKTIPQEFASNLAVVNFSIDMIENTTILEEAPILLARLVV